MNIRLMLIPLPLNPFILHLNCGNDDLADWKSDGPTNIPGDQTGGMVTAIYNHPNHLNKYLVGSKTSGIFKSNDVGSTWNCVTDQLPFQVLGIKQIIASPNNPDFLFALTGTNAIKGGVIFNSNSGFTWEKVNQSLPQASESFMTIFNLL
jgi:hypothetical protein